MCGIAGILAESSPEAIDSALDRMLLATLHRGPNHNGQYHEPGLAIGMNRLSIIDLSAQANQPLFSPDGRYVIVYNGEVYNYLELKQELQQSGYRFTSHSDTEVVLAAYVRYGKDMLEKIRGMFAFVIWDKLEKSLFGARDHLGIKPLLYANTGRHFLFCSELKGMIASGMFSQNRLDLTSLATYLSVGHVIPPFTMIEGISALRNGYYFTYSKGQYEEKPYWFPENFTLRRKEELTYEEAVSTVRNLVLNSVREELMSDVPLGVFLSGGMDSAIVAAAMKLEKANDIRTFTIGFEHSNNDIDEREDAAVIARHFDTRHESIRIENAYIRDNFQDFIVGLDQPSADGLNTYLVSKYAAKYVTVALSGLGGDELFIGYHGFFQFLRRKNRYPWFPFQNSINTPILGKMLPDKIYYRLYREFAQSDDILQYVFTLQRNFEYFNEDLLAEKFRLHRVNCMTKKVIEENYRFSGVPLIKIKQLYTNQYMGNMLLRDSDAVAMKNSLEVRFPLIDKRLVEFVYTLPQEYLIQNINLPGGRNYQLDGWKRVLRDAFKEDLPDRILNRNKRGFQLPTIHWLKGPLKEFLEDSTLNPSYFFNLSAVKKSYNRWLKNPDKWKEIWSIFILDRWYKSMMKTYDESA
jgi:asparagine synthase (glutamine-hydrolysing)